MRQREEMLSKKIDRIKGVKQKTENTQTCPMYVYQFDVLQVFLSIFLQKKNDDFISFACSCVAHRLLCTCPSRALFLARLLFNFMNTPAQTLYLHRVNLMRSFFAMKNLWHTLVGFALQTLLIVQNKMREPTAFAQFHAYIAHSPWTCVFIILIFLLTSILAHSFCALIHQSSFKCGCSLSLTLHVFMCVRYRIF